ncbi:hypothetical protein [Rhodopseudomonas palustris]|uniref:hypothetical protein n=1 Tax=Rhodopseudomonas palustris TaxID=1076 RepID=UPI000CEC83FE|nr:hypothetical protein [Rhodopseudomonas palustris]PPQ42142.1 hypothetical protein CKO39_18300 [Rhodopseudomonas palustris]
MAEAGKTSTFVLHHDSCDPSKWTIVQWRALANFAKYGDLATAESLAKCGLRLVTSDHFVPRGGTLQQVGFVAPHRADEIVAELQDVQATDGVNPFPVQRAYLGPVEWVTPVPFGDGDGNFETYEFEFKATEAEARARLADIYEETAAQD